ncbi:hypothetical protein GOODEAATRI_002636, partial [Goodea atripinnis]
GQKLPHRWAPSPILGQGQQTCLSPLCQYCCITYGALHNKETDFEQDHELISRSGELPQRIPQRGHGDKALISSSVNEDDQSLDAG